MLGVIVMPDLIYDFDMVSDLVYNASVINGTPCYESVYAVVLGFDYLLLAITALLVVNIIILAFVVMRVDLS